MTPGFLTPLDARKIAPQTWRLLAPLRYASAIAGAVIEVPAGFVTDFDSIPRWLPLTYAFLANRIQEEAAVHDFLYRRESLVSVSRKIADDVLYEAMETQGEPWLARTLIWAGVRAGGWTAYHQRGLTERPA